MSQKDCDNLSQIITDIGKWAKLQSEDLNKIRSLLNNLEEDLNRTLLTSDKGIKGEFNYLIKSLNNKDLEASSRAIETTMCKTQGEKKTPMDAKEKEETEDNLNSILTNTSQEAAHIFEEALKNRGQSEPDYERLSPMEADIQNLLDEISKATQRKEGMTRIMKYIEDRFTGMKQMNRNPSLPTRKIDQLIAWANEELEDLGVSIGYKEKDAHELETKINNLLGNNNQTKPKQAQLMKK